jgi:Cu/Ag efflux protein CusF
VLALVPQTRQPGSEARTLNVVAHGPGPPWKEAPVTIPRFVLFATALTILAPALPVHAAREFSRGNITAVDWRLMQIEIRTPQGGLLTYKVAPNCSVKFTDKVAEYRNPKLQDLVPPMYIHFVFENQTMYEIDVREVGAVAQPRGQTTDRDRNTSERGRSSDRDRDDRQVKVRILRIDERRGTFEADVAGRRQTFRAQSNRMLRDFGEGDLVILSFDRRGGSEVVTDIRTAGQSGRVTQVDERRGEVRIEVRRRVSVYQVDDRRLLRRLRVGDRVAFEVEERRGQRVITSIE